MNTSTPEPASGTAVLVYAGERSARLTLHRLLTAGGIRVRLASGRAEAAKALGDGAVRLVLALSPVGEPGFELPVMPVDVPTDADGAALLDRVRALLGQPASSA